MKRLHTRELSKNIQISNDDCSNLNVYVQCPKEHIHLNTSHQWKLIGLCHLKVVTCCRVQTFSKMDSARFTPNGVIPKESDPSSSNDAIFFQNSIVTKNGAILTAQHPRWVIGILL